MRATETVKCPKMNHSIQIQAMMPKPIPAKLMNPIPIHPNSMKVNVNVERPALSNIWVSTNGKFHSIGSLTFGLWHAISGDLEHQFTILREQLYQERIKQNDLHLNDVRNGRSQEYLEPLKQLTDAMQSRIEVAGVLKRLRLENINHKFLAEEQGALQHFEVSEFCFGNNSLSIIPFTCNNI